MPSVGASRSTGGVRPHRSSASHPPLRRARPRARRRSGPSLVIRGLVLLGLLLVLIAVTAVGATGFVAMSSIATLSQDLPDPEALSTLSFDEPTLVYDRTGKVQLGRFERAARHVVDYRQIPRARARCDDDRRGPDVLGQRRLRRPGDGRGRDRDAPGRRPRRVDDHPAARPGAAAAGRRRRSRRRPVRAQGEGDHPVGPPDPGLPRPDRQAADHHRVPEPGLLRPRRVRDRGRGPDLLRHLEAVRPDARPGRAARRPPQVALEPRPVPLRRDQQEGPAGRAAGCPADDPARLDPRQPRRLALDAPDAAAARGGQDRAGDPARRPAADLQGAALHVAGARRAGADPRVGRRRRDRRLPRHHDARLARPADRPAPAGGRGRGAQPAARSSQRAC